MVVIVGIRIFAIPDALIVLNKQSAETFTYSSKETDLILGEKSITAASKQHHGYQEGNKGFERHYEGGGFSVKCLDESGIWTPARYKI